MNKSIKLMGLCCSLLVCFGITIYFYKLNMINYVLVFGVIDLILFGIVMNFIISNRSDESVFNNRINKIIKTYESILVKSLNVPTLDNKNLVYVETMENLVDAQSELRKPIYYFLEDKCCTFVLKDTEDVLIYIVKVNESIESSVERDYKVLKKKEEKAKDSIDKKVLEDLDKTTVFVINDKMLKVSPVRDKDKIKKEDTKKDNNTNNVSKELEKNNKELIDEIEKVKVNSKDEIKQVVEEKISKEITNNLKNVSVDSKEEIKQVIEEKISKEISNNLKNVKVDSKDEIKQVVEDKINKEIKIQIEEIQKEIKKEFLEVQKELKNTKVKVKNTDAEVMKEAPKKKKRRKKNTKKTEVIDNAKNKKK